MRWLFFIVTMLTLAAGISLPFYIPWPGVAVPEAILLLLLVCLIILRIKAIRPIMAVRTGVSLLNEQDFSSRLTHVGQRDADSIAATFNRMIETLKNERLRVMEQNHFLDMLINASPAGILVMNYDGTVRTANPAARQMLGTHDVAGKPLAALPGVLAKAIAGLNLGDEVTVRSDDNAIYRCTLLSFIDSGFQRRFIMIESLTREIMKAEREAYGKVIRQIGHEVNNTVAGIIPMFETVEMVTDDDDLRTASSSCRERCDSLSRFITRYADVVRLPSPTLRPTDLGALFRSLMPFIESMAVGHDIGFTLEVEEGAVAMADSVQLEQVAVNVVKNAIESIVKHGHIRIRVTAAPAGFEIADNGPGISPEISANLFSPFFSSKKGGQGIGLTLISEILRSHGCTFSLRTSPDDRLTRFTASFPAIS